MKHFTNFHVIIFLIFSSNLVTCKRKISERSLNQNSYVAASILKTLGVKDNFENIMRRFQVHCPNLKVVDAVKKSIKKINFLTSKKAMKIGFWFAKSALKKVFRNRKLRKNNLNRREGPYRNFSPRNFRNDPRSGPRRPPYPVYGRPGPYPPSEGPYGPEPPRGYNGYPPSFLERPRLSHRGLKRRNLSKKATPLKTNAVLKSLCKGVNYPNAKRKLVSFKRIMQIRRKRMLVKVIKTTLRRVLARMLGCKFLRRGPLADRIRTALRKIRRKTTIKDNVLKIANVLKQVTNRRRKPRLVKQTNKLMKKVVVKLFNRKKITESTFSLLNRLRVQNCRESKKCYRYNVFSRKCFLHAQGCLKLRSLAKQAKANKVGNVVSSLIKKFIS